MVFREEMGSHNNKFKYLHMFDTIKTLPLGDHDSEFVEKALKQAGSIEDKFETAHMKIASETRKKEYLA